MKFLYQFSFLLFFYKFLFFDWFQIGSLFFAAIKHARTQSNGCLLPCTGIRLCVWFTQQFNRNSWCSTKRVRKKTETRNDGIEHEKRAVYADDTIKISLHESVCICVVLNTLFEAKITNNEAKKNSLSNSRRSADRSPILHLCKIIFFFARSL